MTTISTTEVGQRAGIWSVPAIDQDGTFGVLLGFTCGVDSSTIFIPEDRFDEADKALPPDLKPMFDAAVDRLPAFKASRRLLLQ